MVIARLGLLIGCLLAAVLPVRGSYMYSFSESWSQQQSSVTLGFSFETQGLLALVGDNTGDGALWATIPASAFLTCDLSAFVTPGNLNSPTCNSAGLTQGGGTTSIALILNNAFGDPDTFTVAHAAFVGENLQTPGTWTAPIPTVPDGLATLTIVDPIDAPPAAVNPLNISPLTVPEPSPLRLLAAVSLFATTAALRRRSRLRR